MYVSHFNSQGKHSTNKTIPLRLRNPQNSIAKAVPVFDLALCHEDIWGEQRYSIIILVLST
jgi:hypothetical protein